MGIISIIVLFGLEECIRLYINEYDLPFIVVDKTKCSKNDFLCYDDNNMYVEYYYSLGFTLKKTYNLNNISSEDNIVLIVVRNEFLLFNVLKFGNVLIRSIIRIKRNSES